MTIEKRKNIVNKAIKLVTEAEDLLQSIIWEKQEGQSDHFNNLSKLEQIKLSGTHHSLKLSLISLNDLDDIYEFES